MAWVVWAVGFTLPELQDAVVYPARPTSFGLELCNHPTTPLRKFGCILSVVVKADAFARICSQIEELLFWWERARWASVENVLHPTVGQGRPVVCIVVACTVLQIEVRPPSLCSSAAAAAAAAAAAGGTSIVSNVVDASTSMDFAWSTVRARCPRNVLQQAKQRSAVKRVAMRYTVKSARSIQHCRKDVAQFSHQIRDHSAPRRLGWAAVRLWPPEKERHAGGELVRKPFAPVVVVFLAIAVIRGPNNKRVFQKVVLFQRIVNLPNLFAVEINCTRIDRLGL